MMSFFRKMRLSRKFTTAFGSILLLCLFQEPATLIGLYKIDTLTQDLTADTPGIVIVQHMPELFTRALPTGSTASATLP